MTRVDVVIALFNKGPFVEESIRSALSQTHRVNGIYVADDSSTDEGPVIVKRLANECDRIHLIPSPFERPSGPGATRNRALREGKSEFVAFLDADDWWEPTYIADQLALFAPGIGLVHCQSNVVDGYSGRHKYVMRNAPMPPPEDLYDQVRLEIYRIGCPSAVMVRRSCLSKSGDFSDELLNLGDDWEMWGRLAALTGFAQNNATLCNIRDLSTPSKTLDGIDRFVQWVRVFDRWKDDQEFLPKAIWMARKKIRPTLARALLRPDHLLRVVPRRVATEGGVVGRLMYPTKLSFMASLATLPLWLGVSTLRRVARPRQ